MCGIAGVLNFEREASVDRDVVTRMTRLLAHRGPDAEGIHVQGNVGLGHRRLSVLDLSANANQPMANDDRSVWITYNGEIYNFQSLRRRIESRGFEMRTSSDTEVVLRLYEIEGDGFVEHLHGMYAIAIWDANRSVLLLARDRLGIKPLYYHVGTAHVSFASELKSLLAEPRTPTLIDYDALSDYLHLMSIPDPRSILHGVKKLEPGHVLSFENGRARKREYWQIPLMEPRQISMEVACEEFAEHFSSAVRSHLVADVPVGAFLSGGVDSSAVVAFMGRESSAGMYTFSTTFRGLDTFDEGPYAREVAELCGTRHREVDLGPESADALPAMAWHCDEPFAISSALALYFLARRAREEVKVVLTGDGGDEVFAGYTWKHVDFPPLPARVPAALHGPIRGMLRVAMRVAAGRRFGRSLAAAVEPDERYVRSSLCFEDQVLKTLMKPDIWPVIERAWSGNVSQQHFDRAHGHDELTRKLYTDLKSTLVSEMLTKVDRMTMAFGLEARVPFLDHRLVEWAFSLPSAFKMNGGEGKIVVKRAAEELLPANILHRPKHGFNVPLGRWLRGSLRELSRCLLSEDSVRRRGLFDPEAVSELLQQHEAGCDDIGNRIFVLMMLELWWREVLDRRFELLRGEARA